MAISSIPVRTAGRTDLDEFFTQSGLFGRTARWKHAPALAFITSYDGIEVRIIHQLADLLALPDDTPVMQQWPGQWRSDFFRYTVGDLRRIKSF